MTGGPLRNCYLVGMVGWESAGNWQYWKLHLFQPGGAGEQRYGPRPGQGRVSLVAHPPRAELSYEDAARPGPGSKTVPSQGTVSGFRRFPSHLYLTSAEHRYGRLRRDSLSRAGTFDEPVLRPSPVRACPQAVQSRRHRLVRAYRSTKPPTMDRSK